MKRCGRSADTQCLGLSGALARYAQAHSAATRSVWPPGGMHVARLLVIRDHWINVGMGFMPSHVATVVLFCLSAGIYVYFENYGRYDWTRYFHGMSGLDLRWTPARQRMWRLRFRSVNISKTHVEVWHEDGSRRGDEEWEETLSHHLANSSVRWIHLNGWATTINWRRVLMPAFPKAVEDFRRRVGSRSPTRHAGGPRGGGGSAGGGFRRRSGRHAPGRQLGSAELDAAPVPLRGPSMACMSCAVFALFRPRAVLRRALSGSPIASSAPLACLKGRTMYAEDKRFFPDSLPPSLDAIDALWTSYSGHLGDTTFWGPRDRLRCFNRTASSLRAHASGSAPQVAAATTPDPKYGGRSLVLPSAALHCMESVRAAMSSTRARLFVAVDAPRLQETIFLLMGERAFITPGVGVDPTNEYRDEKQSSLRLMKPQSQHAGAQDLAERNLIKARSSSRDMSTTTNARKRRLPHPPHAGLPLSLLARAGLSRLLHSGVLPIHHDVTAIGILRRRWPAHGHHPACDLEGCARQPIVLCHHSRRQRRYLHAQRGGPLQ